MLIYQRVYEQCSKPLLVDEKCLGIKTLYLTYLDYVMDYHPLWESGKKESDPEGPESMNVYQHLHTFTP